MEILLSVSPTQSASKLMFHVKYIYWMMNNNLGFF